jgi:TRAP-type C4-dicarboxylate transport system permease small subunit
MRFNDPVGRILEPLSKLFAIAGGLMMTALTLMSLYSIVMRNLLGNPIQGDFELVQIGCAIAVAAFLPYCQLRDGNIVVDFFTMRASHSTKSRLDGFAAVLMGLALGLLAWRGAVGGLSAKASAETSMIMGLPVWWGYAPMALAFALASVTAFYCAWRHWALGEVSGGESEQSAAGVGA